MAKFIETISYVQNREIAWLKFNERVLEEANDITVPLFERLKFISIFTKNLDEFFMIRVGSLLDMSLVYEASLDRKSGLTPKQQLERIYQKVKQLYPKKDKIFEGLKQELKNYGIISPSMKELNIKEESYVKEYYKSRIAPIISPQVVDSHHPFPYIPSKHIYIAVILKSKHGRKLGLIPIPESLPEILRLPGDLVRYLRMEDVILSFVGDIFSMYEILEKNYLCVTRNADISPDDEMFDINEDFRYRMKKMINKRRKMAVVRLEIAGPLGEHLKEHLCKRFKIEKNQVFLSNSPLSMSFINTLEEELSLSLKRALCYKTYIPQIPSDLVLKKGMMKLLKKKDILLHFPYESMEPFLTLLKEAAYDPFVIRIQITIYRLSSNARIVEYLCAAAENGKEVSVLIELRARFDEQNNIDWSERLEEAGCRIIYGMKDYKVHSKICLITRREKGKFTYFLQVGTGNYNEKTAKLYTDFSLLTTNTELSMDAVNFFKNMATNNLLGKYQHMLVAPNYLKTNLIYLIEEESKRGAMGRIIIKVNSITDMELIQKLSEASCAGVKIDLIVRGICCLLPGVAGKTENITVTSIIGRFLEHARVYSFGNGERQQIYISSADIMTRNMERRVEIACPILDLRLKRVLSHILAGMLYDNVKARKLTCDGAYEEKESVNAPFYCQEYFMRKAMKKSKGRGSNRTSIKTLMISNHFRRIKGVHRKH